MEAKKIYTKPELKSQKIELGVFGNYCDYTSNSRVGSLSSDTFMQFEGE